jgi:hemoglobin
VLIFLIQSKGAKMRMHLSSGFKRFAMVIALFVMVWGASAGCTHQKPKPVAATPSLYERVGGVNNIAVLISDVIDRAYADPVFAANPRIHAAHLRFPKAIYKFNATNLACQVMGGPQVYRGRSLKEAHQHLNINEKEWQELIKIFRDSMNSYKVPAKEQGEIIAILESTRGDVMAPSAK